jgi:DNA polymerase-3 subunit gamma/tau
MILDENIASSQTSHPLQETSSPSCHVVLARRLRPQSLKDVEGQEAAVQYLSRIIEKRKIPHALLLTGPRGTGKTSCARILAKSLCCEKGITLEPCQTCIHCLSITSSVHQDVLEIDGASNTGVDNIRELKEFSKLHPSIARFKIFIIDEVHMLSVGAFNALLKTLEEPPKNVIFILATTELYKLPITVKSRCVTLSLKCAPKEILVSYIGQILTKEGVAFEDETLNLIAREAQGSFRDALSLLEQILSVMEGERLTVEQIRRILSLQGDHLIHELFVAICQKDSGNLLKLIRHFKDIELDPYHVVEKLVTLFKNLLYIKKSYHIEDLTSSEKEFLQNLSHKLNETALIEVLRLLLMSQKDLQKTTVPYEFLEIILIECLVKSDWLSAEELLSFLKTSKASEPLTSASMASAPIASASMASAPMASRISSLNPITPVNPITPIRPIMPVGPKVTPQAPVSVPPLRPEAPSRGIEAMNPKEKESLPPSSFQALSEPSAIEGREPMKQDLKAPASLVDVDRFKTFMSRMEEKNKILAAKAKSIEFTAFNSQKIEILNKNALFFLKEDERSVFEECLKSAFGEMPLLIGLPWVTHQKETISTSLKAIPLKPNLSRLTEQKQTTFKGIEPKNIKAEPPSNGLTYRSLVKTENQAAFEEKKKKLESSGIIDILIPYTSEIEILEDL